ncbi:DUF1996 domain-containing protein [Streptomyces sp. NBC_00322]|uniref:DUF1996 domain-containing protein n=1 Tax=Streptomyces sp. NBC_00322 TaxID=2975712 RepID=UPI002E28EB08|nr:DUF1996 domain-containing protein [Streptomyces sp. NBC_00322]
MRYTARRRSKKGNRVVAASIALMLGGGGLIATNSYASASEGWGPWPGERNEQQQSQTQSASPSASTIKCPEVANGLPEVPDGARAEVDRELATLDSQITEAYQRFADEKEQVERDPLFAQNAVLGPLKDKRAASIDRIAVAISRVTGQHPQRLESMAPCTLQVDDADEADTDGGNSQGQDQGRAQNGDGGQNNGNGNGEQGNGQQENGSGGEAGNGPEASDFVDIQSVQPTVQVPRTVRDASRGTFSTDCGVNANEKFNPDNVIVAPGVSNGAHHMHDYVGNQANDAFASDDDLANGQTTCRNPGDKSTYYWPVLRLQNGQNENDAQADGGGKDKNVGEIQTPAQVTLNFAGSPVGKVTAMPRFLRIITGDAKAFVNGNANANASWSCTGFEDRQLKDKYPICPGGSKVVRTFKFQSCWDGQNTDSANHRTHVAFTDQNGRCPNGFRAIPQLVQRIVYDVPSPVFDGDNPAVFAVDSFPEQLHKPVTDHGDFINVFDDDLMRNMVSCINDGQECGPGDPGALPVDNVQKPEDAAGSGVGTPNAHGTPNTAGEVQQPKNAAGPGTTTPHPHGTPNTAGDVQQPKNATGAGANAPSAQRTPAVGKNDLVPDGGGEQQAGAGGLAATGAQLWPSAAGAVLLIAGIVLLRTRRTPRGVARHR